MTSIADSPLARVTADSGAVFAAVGDRHMPATYGDPDAEYHAARTSAVVRDLSHWSLLSISGRDHLDFLHRMTTNDFLTLEVGALRCAVFTDNRGRILELADLYRLTEEVTLAVSSPLARQRLPEWFDRYLFSEDVRIEDRADELAMMEIRGPTAGDAVRSVFGVEVDGERAGLLNEPGDNGGWVLTQGRPQRIAGLSPSRLAPGAGRGVVRAHR